MKSIFVSLLVGMMASVSALAETANVKVNGMVCSFCAQGIKKKFSAHEGVESVDVDLDKKNVKIVIKKDKKLPDDEIKTMIKESGYVVEKIDRNL
jgi:mercuric ion binding protein